MSEGPLREDSSDLLPHDVLAAEEFALPAPDQDVGHPHAVLPEDPSGIPGPHDVLAAEEFALPASPPHAGSPVVQPPGPATRQPLLIVAAIGLLILGGILRRRRRAQ